MNKLLRPIPLLLAAAFAGGCTSTPKQSEVPSAAELDAMSRQKDQTGPVTATTTTPLSPFDDPSSPLYRRVIYFDYDTAEIQPEYTALLRTHANYLYNTPGARVTLVGHTDERGTRDYNLALGDERANTVERFLVAEGVAGDRVTTLSYGEERPADPNHGEQAWSQNRRVELVY